MRGKNSFHRYWMILDNPGGQIVISEDLSMIFSIPAEVYKCASAPWTWSRGRRWELPSQNVQFVGPQLCSLVGASQSLSKGLVHHRAAMFFLSLQDELHAGPSSGSMLHKDHNMDPSFDLMYVFFSDFDVVLYVLSCAEPLHTSSNFWFDVSSEDGVLPARHAEANAFDGKPTRHRRPHSCDAQGWPWEVQEAVWCMVGIQTCCCLIKFVLTLLGLNHPYHFYPESKWIYFHLGYALPMGYLHICLGNFTPDPLGGSGLSYTNGLIVLMVSLMFSCWNCLVANEVSPLGSTLLWGIFWPTEFETRT